MAEKFKEGDQVRLKSGGPDMTVNKVSEGIGLNDITIHTVWFDERCKLNTGAFSPDALDNA